MTNLTYKKFSDIDQDDDFFDSLKGDYKEFPDWFAKKAAAGERAYIMRRGGYSGISLFKN